MTKRLQILIDDDELTTIQRLARQERVTTVEWVRRRLRESIATRLDTATKLAAIHAVYRHSAPAPDIDEIERG